MILFTNVTLPYMSHKLTVKPIVAHDVKANWLSSVRSKRYSSRSFRVILAAYCIK